MKKLLGAVIGGSIGFITPLVLAVGNETLFIKKQLDNGSQIWDVVQICAFERRWFPLYPKVIHAPGCQNKTLGILPGLLLLSTPAGLVIGAILSKDKRSSRRTSDVNSQDSSQITESVAASLPEQTPDPVERSLKDAPKPSLPSIAPQVSQGLEQLKGLNWNKIGKGAAVAGVVVLAYTQLNPSSTNMPGSPGGNENKLFNSKIQRRITIIDSANEYGYWGTYDRTRLTYTRSTYEICKEKLGALSNSELDDLLANGAKVVGNASNVYDKTIETPFTNGMGGTTMGYLVCQIKDYVIEE